MDKFSGTNLTSFCKLIYIDYSPVFRNSPVVCIQYDDYNETLRQLCAGSKAALQRASRNFEKGLNVNACCTEEEMIPELKGPPNVAEAGYWVLGGVFGAAVRASNKKQFEQAWALAALIGMASFSRKYEPTTWFYAWECNATFDRIVQEIKFPPPPPDAPPPNAHPPNPPPPPPPPPGPPPNAPPDIPECLLSCTSEAYVVNEFTDITGQENWQTVWSDKNHRFLFWNTLTNETRWDPPS